MNFGLLIGLLIVLPIVWLAWVVVKAPEWYEDDDGFHYGSE